MISANQGRPTGVITLDDGKQAVPGEHELAAMRTVRDDLSGLKLVVEAFPRNAEVFGGHRAVPTGAECITASSLSLETLSDNRSEAEMRRREEQHRDYSTLAAR